MKKTTAAAAAGAVALTATGAVSALFLTIGQTSAPALAADPGTTVVTEYVDQNGNPVAAPDGQLDLSGFVVVDAPAATPEVIEEIEYVTTYTQAPAAPYAGEYGEEEYEEEDEYEDHDDEEEYEDDEEYEDEEGYEEAEGYEDHEEDEYGHG